MAITATFGADFSKFKAAVDAAETQLTGFQANASKVQSSLNRMSDALSGTKIVQQATIAAEAVTRLGGSAGTAGGILKLTDQELAKLGDTASAAAAKMTALGQKVPEDIQQIANAAENATRSVKSTADQLSSLGTIASSIGVSLTAAITAPLVAAAVAGVHFGAEFETQMTRVQTLAGASKEEVAKMGQEVLDLAPKVGVGPAELAKGLFVVESAGFSGAAAMGLLTTAAKMTALGMGETDAVARSLVGVMLSYTKENLSAAEAGDLLVKTVQLGNVKIDELVPALAKVNPVAAALGIKFEDVAAAVATFTHMGADSTVAATGLRAVLSNILNDSAKTERGFVALQRATGDLSITMADFKARMNTQGLGEALLHLMEQANSAGEQGIEALNKVFPNIKALTEVLAIAGSQADNYVRITTQMHQAAGVLDAGFTATQETFTQKWKELSAQVDVLFIKLGQELLPTLSSVVKILSEDGLPALEKALALFSSLPEGVKTTAIALAAVTAALGPAVFLLGSFAGAAAQVAKAFALLSGAEVVGGMAGVVGFLANPLVLAGAVAIGGIALAVYELHKNLSDLGHVSSAGTALSGLTDSNGKLLLTADAARQASTELGNLKDGMTIAIPSIHAFADASTGLAKAHLTVAEQVKALTAAQRAEIDQAMLGKESIKEIAEETGIAGDVIALYERQTKAATKAETDHESAMKALRTAQADALAAMIPLTDAQQKAVLGYQALGLGAHETALLIGAADIQVKVFESSLKDQEAEMSANERETAALQTSLGKLLVGYNATGKAVVGFTGILHTIDPTLIQNSESLVQMEARLKATEESFKKAFGAFASLSLGLPAGLNPSGQVDDALKNTDHMAHTLELDLDGISRAFDRIGISSSSGLGKAATDFVSLAKLIEKTNAEVDKVQTQFGADSPQATAASASAKGKIANAAIGVGAGLIAQTIDTGPGASTGSLVASGALQGAAAGSVAGPWGTAVGAGVGAVVGWIQSGQEWRKVVNDISRDMGGIKVSEDFAKMIAALEDQSGLGRTQALTTQIDQLVVQAGGLNANNIVLFTSKLRDAFSYLQVGQLTLAETTQTLDKNFANFATVGTDAYGRLADNVKELITLNDQYGTQSQAIATYLQQQGTNAITGFDAVVAGTVDAVTGYDALKKAVDDATTAQNDLVKAGTVGTIETAQAALAVTTALHNQFDGAEKAKQGLSDLGLQAIASFTAAVAAGVPVATALGQIHPALVTLKQSYSDLGLDIQDVGLKNLIMQDTILSGNPALVGALAGLTGEMISLDNMGLLNVDTFKAMQRTGLDMYTRLQNAAVQAGGTTKDALLPMQDWLHQATIEADKLGVPLDANTQELIKQSKELGIWKDAGKTATDILTASMQTLVDKVGELIDRLNGIPTKINTNVNVNTTTTSTPADNKNDPTQPDGPYPQASGGDYWVTKPTLFLAGEAGPERASFGGAGRGSGTQTSSGGNSITITVPVNLDGREITRIVVPLVPSELRRMGVI